MAKNPIPRLSSQVGHLLHALTTRGGPQGHWLLWELVKRGKKNHRPAWSRSGYEVPMYDTCRAVALGVVEARTYPIDDTEAGKALPLGAQDIESIFNEPGARIQLRVTQLGRAAMATAELKEGEPKKARPDIRVVQPMLLPRKPGP